MDTDPLRGARTARPGLRVFSRCIPPSRQRDPAHRTARSCSGSLPRANRQRKKLHFVSLDGLAPAHVHTAPMPRHSQAARWKRVLSGHTWGLPMKNKHQISSNLAHDLADFPPGKQNTETACLRLLSSNGTSCWGPSRAPPQHSSPFSSAQQSGGRQDGTRGVPLGSGPSSAWKAAPQGLC